MTEETKYKVCVRCATFNHAPYITATMDGFCHQQTTFPFVCIIIDDASKDGEQEVIGRYLRDHFGTGYTEETEDYLLTVAGHKENRNCHFAVLQLKYNHYSIRKSPLSYVTRWQDTTDYVALCEGDDYWTDPHKLQEQADALDAHPHAVMAYTGYRVVDSNGNTLSIPKIDAYARRSHSGDNLPTLLHYGNHVMTLTAMYRHEVWQSEAYLGCPHRLDFGLTLAAALMGDFLWTPKVTACYRSLQSGMVKSDMKRGMQMIQEIYRYYARLVMAGTCKPLPLRKRIRIRTLILMRALKKKDRQLKAETLEYGLLSWVLLPVAYIRYYFFTKLDSNIKA